MHKIAITIVVVAAACAAAAEPLPSYVAFPAGYSAGKVEHHKYDQIEIAYPNPADPRSGSLHAKPAGRWWRVDIAGDLKKFDFKVWRPVLEHAGWQTLVDHGAIVLKHPASASSGEAWLSYSRNDRFDLVEQIALPPLALVAPGETPEALKKDHDVPYLTPLPAMKMTKWMLDEHTGEEMTGPKTGGPFIAGPPAVRLTYLGDRNLSALELQASYKAALERAGWDINFSNDAGTTVAHYAQHGRDVWAKVEGVHGELHLTVADIGANAAASKLKAALDRDGHVALYGIYFDIDKDVLRPDSEATLQQILALLEGAPQLTLEIQGHTDNTGSRPHNDTLSAARAASVKSWLVGHKIAAGRLTTRGYADTKPVADNSSAAGRAKNRRVELAKQRS